MGSLVAAVLVTIVVMVVMAVGAFLVYFFVIKKARENVQGKRGCIKKKRAIFTLLLLSWIVILLY